MKSETQMGVDRWATRVDASRLALPSSNKSVGPVPFLVPGEALPSQPALAARLGPGSCFVPGPEQVCSITGRGRPSAHAHSCTPNTPQSMSHGEGEKRLNKLGCIRLPECPLGPETETCCLFHGPDDRAWGGGHGVPSHPKHCFV